MAVAIPQKSRAIPLRIPVGLPKACHRAVGRTKPPIIQSTMLPRVRTSGGPTGTTIAVQGNAKLSITDNSSTANPTLETDQVGLGIPKMTKAWTVSRHSSTPNALVYGMDSRGPVPCKNLHPKRQSLLKDCCEERGENASLAAKGKSWLHNCSMEIDFTRFMCP